MLDKQCICGHARSAHTRGYAECKSVNVLDDCFDEFCECARFKDAPVESIQGSEKVQVLKLLLEWLNAK